MSVCAKHITFVGRVQGVGFRFTVLRIANNYGLAGFVRNMRDGSVEMVGQGHPDDIADCIEDIKNTFQDGLKETRLAEIEPSPEYQDFKITF